MGFEENNQPVFVPVVAAIIENDAGQILLARRRKALSNGGLWEFPGGKLRPREDPVDCLKREIREELGVEIEVKYPFQIVNHPLNHRNLLLLAFWCSHISGEWQLTDHDRIGWFEPAKILELPLSAPDVPVARSIARSRNTQGG